MIDQVDATLGELIRAEALPGWDAEVVFDAPDREWSGRRTKPVVDVFLYEVREDSRRREAEMGNVRGADGRIVGRRRPPRHFTLSYLVTTWARRSADEHRLLAQVIVALLRFDRIPPDYLRGALAEQDAAVLLSLAVAPGRERSVTDIWSVLGGQLHPSIDLTVTVPIDPLLEYPVGPPVTEQPDLRALRTARTARSGTRPSRTPRPLAASSERGSPTRGHIEEP